MASKCSREGKSHRSLILNQRLGTIKLSEEGVSRASRLKAKPLEPESS